MGIKFELLKFCCEDKCGAKHRVPVKPRCRAYFVNIQLEQKSPNILIFVNFKLWAISKRLETRSCIIVNRISITLEITLLCRKKKLYKDTEFLSTNMDDSSRTESIF